jgi:hypothetical protein
MRSPMTPTRRRRAESLMLDTCTVEAITGVTTDPLTGEDTPAYAPVYTGRCKVQGLDPLERNPEAGGATYTVQRYRVDVPVGAFVPAVGQRVTITAATLDPNLTGQTFRVVALLHKTAATAYRLGVEHG